MKDGKPSAMTQSRIDLLESIDFSWSIRPKPQDTYVFIGLTSDVDFYSDSMILTMAYHQLATQVCRAARFPT